MPTACLFFWIAYGYADPDGTEYQQYLFSNGWVSGDGTLDEEGLVPENGTEPWVSAMYWAGNDLRLPPPFVPC